jgi:hypothetical protein
MRPVAIVGLLSATFALVACAAGVSPALRQMAARRDAAHPVAGVPFPQRSAGFVRTEVTRFDREGRDVAAHYAIRGYSFTRILASLYVYPATPATADLREEFDRRRRELEAAKPATLVAERELRLGRGGLEARCAAYALQGGTVLETGPGRRTTWWNGVVGRLEGAPSTLAHNGGGGPRRACQNATTCTWCNRGADGNTRDSRCAPGQCGAPGDIGYW